MDFRNAGLSHVLFSKPLCVFHTPGSGSLQPPGETSIFFSVHCLFATRRPPRPLLGVANMGPGLVVTIYRHEWYEASADGLLRWEVVAPGGGSTTPLCVCVILTSWLPAS